MAKSSKTNPFVSYVVDESKLVTTEDGRVPLIHWPVTPNFGDLLSPWLITKMTGLETMQNKGQDVTYIAIGSVLNRVKDKTIVWGSGAFGVEREGDLNPNATYLAVRGPLSRSILLSCKIPCPRVYGDPALLIPYFHEAPAEKRHKTGIVVRWSDNQWKKLNVADDITIIDLNSEDVEGTLDSILQCEKIVTSSLHGLVIADAYGIPSAWLASKTPKGREFKYYDYFLSVNKIRDSQDLAVAKVGFIDEAFVEENLTFDDRPIQFDAHTLLEVCPFLSRIDNPSGA